MSKRVNVNQNTVPILDNNTDSKAPSAVVKKKEKKTQIGPGG